MAKTCCTRGDRQLIDETNTHYYDKITVSNILNSIFILEAVQHDHPSPTLATPSRHSSRMLFADNNLSNDRHTDQLLQTFKVFHFDLKRVTLTLLY